MIPYDDLSLVNKRFRDELMSSFRGVLDGGWFVLGDAVRIFERSFAKAAGAEECVGVASGLDALTLTLRALDLPEGHEVLVASNTFIATILGIVNAGLTPVLVEPDPATYNIDPGRIEDKITART